MHIRRSQYETRAEFRTVSDKRAWPGNEASLSLIPCPPVSTTRAGSDDCCGGGLQTRQASPTSNNRDLLMFNWTLRMITTSLTDWGNTFYSPFNSSVHSWLLKQLGPWELAGDYQLWCQLEPQYIPQEGCDYPNDGYWHCLQVIKKTKLIIYKSLQTYVYTLQETSD